MADPITDLELRLQRLEAKVDLTDQEIRSNIEGMKEDLARLEGTYVPMLRYLPVERLVYGVVTLLLTSVIVAVVAIAFGGDAP